MAVRIQLRRDTAANWVSSNPVLRAGELGIETDTLKFKIGNGSAWNSISNYANVVPSDLNTTLGDYVTVNDIGAQGGVVGLNNSYNAIIPGSSIILEGPTADSYETTLSVTDPTEDRTITFPDATGTVALTSQLPTQYTDELAQDAVAAALAAGTHTNITVTYNDNANTLSLAAAPGYVDEQAVDAVAQALANGTHTNITVGYSDETNAISLTGATTYSDENAQDAVGNILTGGLTYSDSTPAIGINYVTLGDTLLDGVSGASYGLIGTSTYLDVKNTNGYNKEIELDIAAVESKLVTDGFAKLNNPTFTGTVTLPGNPSTANEAATKSYVDNISAGLNFHAAVHAATTADLSATYDNSAKTLSASGAFPQIDGQTISETERVLVKSQTNAVQNGIYTLTDDGDPSGTWVLTRAADADNTPSGEMAYGDFTFVQNGTSNGGQGFIMTTTGTITLGTSNIVYTQFNTGQSVIAGNGLSEPTAGTLAINTAITADLSTAQTLTNKTLTSPTITGTGAIAGTFTGNLTGNVTGDVSGNAGTVTNGVVTTGTYSNPSWITGLAWSKISSTPTTISGYGITNAVVTDAANIITAATSSTKPLIVKSAPSQSANLFEAQNVSGGVLFSITPSGVVKAGGNIETASSLKLGDTGGTFPARLNIITSSGAIGSVIKGASGQTANLSEWQNSSGVVLASINPNGELTLPNINIGALGGIYNVSGGSYITFTGSAATFNPYSSSKIGVIVKGASSQSASLTEWQNSSGTVLASVNASGQFVGDGSQLTGLTTALTTPSTVTLTANTATTVDTTALSAFTSLEYMVSIKQGSKVRTSKLVVQTDGTSVDMTEFAITETGGTISGVVVSAAVSGTDAVLQATVTDAATTNAAVKLAKIKL